MLLVDFLFFSPFAIDKEAIIGIVEKDLKTLVVDLRRLLCQLGLFGERFARLWNEERVR